MADRFELNPKRIFGARQRAAYDQARQRLEAGARCDDCAELHDVRKAVSFVIKQDREPDLFFVSFLCQYHADIFLMRQDASGVFVNGKKVLN
jgi:hypothetical protein